MKGSAELTSNWTRIVDVESGLVDHEASDSERRVWKNTIFSIMFIFPMVVLIWIACSGYKLTAMKYVETNLSEDGCIALLFGVVTLIFGLIYFVIGLTIVAELALDWFRWLPRLQDTGTPENEEKEQMTYLQICVQTLAITASMFMLAWAIYYGYKLATEAQDVVIYTRLPFLIGLTSMGFGFIYFINGIGILAESALHLTRILHPVDDPDEKSDALLDRRTKVIPEV